MFLSARARRTVVVSVVGAALLAASVAPAAAGFPATVNPEPPAAQVEVQAPTTIQEAREASERAAAAVAPAQEAADRAYDAKVAADLAVTIAQTEKTAAESRLAAAIAVRVEKQAQVEQMARTMYMTGGSTTPIDLLLVDPGERPGAALDTHEYLDSAANDMVLQSSAAISEEQAAQADLAVKTEALTNAQQTATEAQDALRAAQEALSAARTAAADAERAYKQFIYQFTPATGQALLDPSICQNWLVRVLYKAGFRGEDLREAWAIVMRESGGREDAVSSTQDYGMFQINRPTFGSQPWWDDELMLTRDYNAAIGFKLSQGGRSWLPWGLDGHGRANPLVYERSGWSEQMIYDRIIEPYSRWYGQYPCVDMSASTPSVSVMGVAPVPAGEPLS